MTNYESEYNLFKISANDLLVQYKKYRYDGDGDYYQIYADYGEFADCYNEINDSELEKINMLEEYNKIYDDIKDSFEWLDNHDPTAHML